MLESASQLLRLRYQTHSGRNELDKGFNPILLTLCFQIDEVLDKSIPLARGR